MGDPLWSYPGTRWRGDALIDYDVEAIDGAIGTVDEATSEVDGSYLVVDTGPWIFGKKVVLPAGVVDRIDEAENTIYVNRTKDEIKNAPEFDEDGFQSDAYRARLGRYYGPGGLAYREGRSRPEARHSA